MNFANEVLVPVVRKPAVVLSLNGQQSGKHSDFLNFSTRCALPVCRCP